MTLASEPFVSKPIDPKSGPHAPRFSKSEFLNMVEIGAFDGRRVFLFRGELIEMAPMATPHALGVQECTMWSVRVLGGRFKVRVQSPFDTPGESLPEPDICVLSVEDSRRAPHPNRAQLLIEVADSSLRLDRAKAHEYAAGANEYWILDVRRRVLHVYRKPHDDPAGLHGRAFDPPVTLDEHATVAPLCEPTAAVKVSDLLPPAA